MTSLLVNPELQFIDENGEPYAGGTLSFFIPGTLTMKNTWQDANQVTLNSNPIVLDMAGRCVVFGAGSYRVQLTDQYGNLIFDQITSSALSEAAVSSFMMPVLAAVNATTAMGLLGITAAIASAIAAVALLPGPTGPTGPTGATGPAGAAGVNMTATVSNANGYYQAFPNGLILQWGTNNTSGTGEMCPFTLPTAFTTVFASIVATEGNCSGWVSGATFGATLYGTQRNGLTGFYVTAALLNSGIVQPDPSSGFNWMAIGW